MPKGHRALNTALNSAIESYNGGLSIDREYTKVKLVFGPFDELALREGALRGACVALFSHVRESVTNISDEARERMVPLLSDYYLDNIGIIPLVKRYGRKENYISQEVNFEFITNLVGFMKASRDVAVGDLDLIQTLGTRR